MIKKIHGRVKRFHLCINFGITSTLTNYKIYAQMKISIGFVIVFLFWTGLAKAQEFHGGVTAGIVGSQVAGDGYSGFKKGGLYAGGYVSLDVSQRSALQLEITYFMKGSQENPREKNNYTDYLFRINYIEMPVLYQFKIGKFIIEAGPSAGILTGYYETDANGYEISDEPGYNKPARLSFQINLGLRFFITDKFGADFRTNNSLLNIRSENRTWDVWRLWTYGQFSDALVLSFFYQFK